MANPEHLEILKQGVGAWNSWRQENYLQHPIANLSGANLSRAILTEANLSGANLSRAILTETNLTGANLTGADLREARGFGTGSMNPSACMTSCLSCFRNNPSQALGCAVK